MKRRALLDRPRSIYTLETMPVDEHHFLVRWAEGKGEGREGAMLGYDALARVISASLGMQMWWG